MGQTLHAVPVRRQVWRWRRLLPLREVPRLGQSLLVSAVRDRLMAASAARLGLILLGNMEYSRCGRRGNLENARQTRTRLLTGIIGVCSARMQGTSPQCL